MGGARIRGGRMPKPIRGPCFTLPDEPEQASDRAESGASLRSCRCVPDRQARTDPCQPGLQTSKKGQPKSGQDLGSCPPGRSVRNQRLREEIVSYVDRTLTCVDCGAEFVHSAEDQEYYKTKGFVSDPKRCPSCRAARRSSRDNGDGAMRGGSAGPREYFAVVCSRCGNQAQVPFRPNMDRPVYCSDCFRIVQAEGTQQTSA